MAQQLWNKEIDKTVDWGGDTSTGGNPVSGQFVQKFIKDSLASKFGYLHYNSDTKKYQVFADEADFNIWNADKTTNANLLLATFDAPAPATIKVTMKSALSNTILLSDRNNKIGFEYIVNDSSNSPITESVTVRMQVTNNGITQTYTFPYGVDYEHYADGTYREIVVDDYLSVGVNEITLNFIGVTTQASAVASVRYTVVDLRIESTWDNTVAQEYDETLDPDLLFDIEKGNVIRIPYKAVGQGAKYIEIYVNGKQLVQDHGGVSFGDLLSGQQEFSSYLTLYLSKNNGELNNAYFHEGKNVLQFRVFVDSDNKKIYSNTLYYEFVVKNVNNLDDVVYILYKQELTKIFQNEEVVTFDADQYFSASFDYSIYSSSGKDVTLTFDLVKRAEGDELAKHIGSKQQKTGAGKTDTFEYFFLDYGTIDINVETDLKDIQGNPLDTLHVIVNVLQAANQINVYEDQLMLNLQALNRSNSEPDPSLWQDGAVKASFENIYWNNSSGWDGKSLVLNNGSICNIPYNFFGNNNNFTVEITFEVVNVQDEDAEILTFKRDGQTSSIIMTASEAKITDTAGNSVHTKYNANEKIKIAFIVNEYDRNNSFDPSYTGKQEYKNCNFLVVNGILDKADVFNGNMNWSAGVKDHKLVIGNKDGKAGIKIYSIRVYHKALTLDDELTNFIAECDDIIGKYNKNNIYQEGTNNVSLDILKNMIPTAVLYGDIESFNALKGKKENMQFDMEFYDPTDEDRDFYARGMWISNQGTSSLKYPIRNLRPYFSKTRDKSTQETSADYYTEVYLSGEFTHGEISNESKLGHFYTNAKTCVDGYHRLYNGEQADKLQNEEGIQLFYAEYTQTGVDKDNKPIYSAKYIPCFKSSDEKLSDAPEGYGELTADGRGGWFIQSYKAVKQYGKVDDYWKFMKDLRLSGVKIYKIASETEVENPKSGKKYKVKKFEQVKGKKAIKKDTQYYIQQGVWKQYHKSGYTDRWTFKADYAESTMTQNAGVGRLWGDAMKNVQIATGSNPYPCRTDAQTAVGNLVTPQDERIDIRTSCDGKPIVAFCCPLKYDEKGNPIVVNGKRQYDNPIFIGLYNIMTDKSSTKLFGFEDIWSENGADEDGNPIYKADRTECFECLTNAAEFSQGLSVVTDTDINNTDPENRSVWIEYESRWPDVGGLAHTHNLESMWRFVNFCKPAVNYYVGIKDSDAAIDGYTQSPFALIDPEKYQEYWDMQPRPSVYTMKIESGNIEYTKFKETDDFNDWLNMSGSLYEYKNNIDYNKVWKELSGKKIEGHVFKGKVACFDAKHGVFSKDIQFDEERVDNPENGVNYGDLIKGSPVETDYYVSVYLTKNGSRYTYTDEYGNTSNYTGESIEADGYEKNSKGESYSGKTFMEYFSDKKYNYFDVPRLAAYYVYLMRFAAADQFVKNSMLTSEDGQHYYYINYDNDTVLGTRNDGNLVFHWSVNRDTYDFETNDFCFAGAKSVLWNLLEMDDDFMKQVKTIDNAMYSSGVLSAKLALEMFNEKQEAQWGERMYNINEKYKYLSQWHGTDATYLAFIHGSAHQFRTWFIENRFNYYDSLWESGEYRKSGIDLRIDSQSASTDAIMFSIVAARQNKFVLTNSDIKDKNPEPWVVNLEQDAEYSFPVFQRTKGMSSPWEFFGTDKLKELNFRPSIGVCELQLLSFVKTGSDWPKSKGCLLTKLLIGNSNEFRSSTMFRYTNSTDQPAILSKATLTDTRTYETSEDLPYDETIIKREVNKKGNYVYSSKTKDEVILPLITVPANGYYDSYTTLTGVDKEIFGEPVGLPPTQCLVSKIGSIGDIYSLEEIDIRNCYNSEGLLNDTIRLENLNNLHIFRAIGSSITVFEPAVGATLNEVSLPINRISSLVLNNVTLKPAEGQDTETNPVFMYQPDYALTTLVLNNVMMDENNPAINIVEFVDNWIELHRKLNTDLKTLSLTLNGVNIENVPVSFVKKLKTEINLVSFTGYVRLVSSDPDNEEESLTEQEYNELVELYSVERPFEPNSALTFDAAEAVYWSVNNGEWIANTEARGGITPDRIYKILHGNNLEFRVTRFPAETELFFYRFDYLENGTWKTASTPTSIEDLNNHIYFKRGSGWNTVLTPSKNGNSGYNKLISILGTTIYGNVNVNRYIRIYPIKYYNVNNYGVPAGMDVDESQALYVLLSPAVLPDEISVTCDTAEIEKSKTATPISITKEDGSIVPKDVDTYIINVDEHQKEFEINIEYSNASQVTTLGKVPVVKLLDDSNSINGSINVYENDKVKVYNTVKGTLTNGGSFKFYGLVNPTNVIQNILIDLELVTDLEDRHRYAILQVNIKPIKPTEVRFVENSKAVIYSEISQFATDPVTKQPIEVPVYGYYNKIAKGEVLRIEIESYSDKGTNVPILNGDILDLQSSNRNVFANPTLVFEDGKCYIELKQGAGYNERNSFDYEYEFKIQGNYGYDLPSWKDVTNYGFNFNFKLDISTIFPEAFKVVYLEDETKQVNDNTNAVNINAKDDGNKIVLLKVVPYNKTQKDPITVNLTSVNIDIPTQNLQQGNYLFETGNTVNSLFSYEVKTEPFVLNVPENTSCSFENGTQIDASITYPIIVVNLEKHKLYTNYFNKLQYFITSININGTYDNKTIESTLPTKFMQSIAYANKIDDCAPYKINDPDEILKATIEYQLGYEIPLCKYYLVDNDNQYYRLENDIIDELIAKGLINKLVGIAERVNYGWDSPNNVEGRPNEAWKQNEEGNANGDRYHNACLYWENDPDISILNKDKNAKNVYFRALCLPLTNWKFDEEKLKQFGYSATAPAGETLNNESKLHLEANKLSGFFVPSARFFATSISNNNFISPKLRSLFGGSINDADEKFTSVSSVAVHNYSRWGSTLSIKARPTLTAGGIQILSPITNKVNGKDVLMDINSSSDGYSPLENSWNQSSFLDSKAPTIAFCSAFNKPEGQSIEEYLWESNTWNMVSNNGPKKLRSGILETWFHFELFNPQLVEPNGDIQEADNSNIHCYIPSPWELNRLINYNTIIKRTGDDPVPYEGIPKAFAEIEVLLNVLCPSIKINNTFIKVFNENFKTVYSTYTNYFSGNSSINIFPVIGSMIFLNKSSITNGSFTVAENLAVTFYKITKNGDKCELSLSSTAGKNESLPSMSHNNFCLNSNNFESDSSVQGKNNYATGIGDATGLWIPLLIVD